MGDMSIKSKNSKGNPTFSKSPSKAVLPHDNPQSGTINSTVDRAVNKDGEEICK